MKEFDESPPAIPEGDEMYENRGEPAWERRGVFDAGGRTARCELCGTGIRWQHRFYNPATGQWIRVGSECAAKLVRGYDAEAAVTDRGKRLRAFLNGKFWKPSRNNPGNTVRRHLVPDGSAVIVTVFESRGQFRVSLSDGHNPPKFLRGYVGATEAKLAAFEAVEEIASRTRAPAGSG